MFFNLYDTVRKRFERLIMPSATLILDAAAGNTRLYCNDLSNFGEDNFILQYNDIILMDKNSTGQKTETGYFGSEILKVSGINYAQNVIELQTPLTRAWTVANQSFVKLCPSGVVVKDVYIGDINVAKDFPCVSINPVSKSTSWAFLQGTKEVITIDFSVYVKDAISGAATDDLMKLTDIVEWILMSNMHIIPKDQEQPTSQSMVKDIQYGVIQKGSTFLKASKLTWSADLYIDRFYIYGKEPVSE